MSAAEALDQIRELERLAGRTKPLRLLGLGMVIAAFVSLVFYLDAERRRLERQVAELNATVEQLQTTLASASRLQAQRPSHDEALARLLAEAGQTASQLQAGVDRLPDDAQSQPTSIPRGVMRLDVPRTMRLGQAYQVSLNLPVPVEPASAGQRVSVQLTSPDFDIKPTTPAVAQLGPDGAEWRWTLVPRASGIRSVNVQTTLYATTPQGSSYPLRTNQVIQAVTVEASLADRFDGIVDVVTSWSQTFISVASFLAGLFVLASLAMRVRSKRFRAAVAAAEEKP